MSLKQFEDRRQKDIEALKMQYEGKLMEIISLNKAGIQEKEKKWTEEKNLYVQQLEFTQQ